MRYTCDFEFDGDRFKQPRHRNHRSLLFGASCDCSAWLPRGVEPPVLKVICLCAELRRFAEVDGIRNDPGRS